MDAWREGTHKKWFVKFIKTWWWDFSFLFKKKSSSQTFCFWCRTNFYIFTFNSTHSLSHSLLLYFFLSTLSLSLVSNYFSFLSSHDSLLVLKSLCYSFQVSVWLDWIQFPSFFLSCFTHIHTQIWANKNLWLIAQAIQFNQPNYTVKFYWNALVFHWEHDFKVY